MKTLLTLALLLTATIASAEVRYAPSSHQHVTKFYSRSGAYQGRSVTSGDRTRFYSKSGAYTGRAQTSGNATRYYDAGGRLTGTGRK